MSTLFLETGDSTGFRICSWLRRRHLVGAADTFADPWPDTDNEYDDGDWGSSSEPSEAMAPSLALWPPPAPSYTPPPLAEIAAPVEACERRAWAALDALADMGGDVGEAMGQLIRSTSGAAYSPTWVRGLRLGCGLRPPPAREVWRPLDYVRHYAAHTCRGLTYVGAR